MDLLLERLREWEEKAKLPPACGQRPITKGMSAWHCLAKLSWYNYTSITDLRVSAGITVWTLVCLNTGSLYWHNHSGITV